MKCLFTLSKAGYTEWLKTCREKGVTPRCDCPTCDKGRFRIVDRERAGNVMGSVLFETSMIDKVINNYLKENGLL